MVTIYRRIVERDISYGDYTVAEAFERFYCADCAATTPDCDLMTNTEIRRYRGMIECDECNEVLHEGD